MKFLINFASVYISADERYWLFNISLSVTACLSVNNKDLQD